MPFVGAGYLEDSHADAFLGVDVEEDVASQTMGPDPGEDGGPFWVPTLTIWTHTNTFKFNVWGMAEEHFTEALIRQALHDKAYEPVPRDRPVLLEQERPDRYDVRRVAYLVDHPATDPICLEFTDEWGSWFIEDGHHRLTAAIIRKDPEILIHYGGYVDGFRRAFPTWRKQTCTTIGS